MKKTLMALAAVATLAVSAVAVPAPAHAQRGVAAGVAAGLIGGAIVGGAIASQNGYYYGPGYYGGGPAYVAGPGYYGPPCYWQRQRFWDGYGWRVRNVQICNRAPFTYIKSDTTSRKTRGFPGRMFFAARKNRFFRALGRSVYVRLSVVRVVL